MELLWNKRALEKTSGASTESKPVASEQTFPDLDLLRMILRDFQIARLLMLMPRLPAVFSDLISRTVRLRVYGSANLKSTLIKFVGRELGQQVIRSILGLDPVEELFTLVSKVWLSTSESEPRPVPVLDQGDFLGMEFLYVSNLGTGTLLEKEAVKRTLKKAKSAAMLAEVWLDMLGSALRKGFPIQVSTDRPIVPPSGPKGRGNQRQRWTFQTDLRLAHSSQILQFLRQHGGDLAQACFTQPAARHVKVLPGRIRVEFVVDMDTAMTCFKTGFDLGGITVRSVLTCLILRHN